MDRFRRRSSTSTASVESTGHLGRVVSRAFGRISSSKNTSIKLDENLDPLLDIKGPLGLNLLHSVPEPLIDFIFVHGLGGGSRKTWALSPDPSHYWPKEWLPQDPDFRFVRIHSFGYNADWDNRGESILSIRDFARSLLGEVHCSPDIRRSKTKIVFVAHSMGGIVIKKAYLLAREDPNLQDLARRIHTLYFLATPHRGSDLAKTLSNILQISFGPVSYGSKPFLAELNSTSETIASINDSFRHVSEGLQLWSFYETAPSNLVLMKALIVDKSSATLGYPNEQSFLSNADHRGICKFDQQTDPNYQTIRKAFITTIDLILSEVSKTASEISKYQLLQVAKLTGVTEPPVGELSTLEEVRVPGSGQWLVSSEAYTSWRTDYDAKRHIFCLTANPGSGKSVLSGRVINDLQERKLKCSYYFFRYRNTTKSKISGCLRSLAYQMAISDDAILRRLYEFQQDSASWEEWDEKAIWRKLFLGCIFKERSSIRHFWVIDALDECQTFPTLLALFSKIPQNLRIFITARKSPEFENWLVKIGHLAKHCQIKTSDTISDLTIFIDSKMDLLPASDENGRDNLKQRILAKASGSFLWVALVVKELEQAYSEEGAEEILNDIPIDMNKYYARMIESAFEKNPRAAVLAKAIFMWTLVSLRPLKVEELQFAIKLDVNQTVHNLEKSVSAICGQLLYVNQKNEVETVHQTAKAFLLQQDNCPDLALSEPQSHSRITHICLQILTEGVFKELQPRLAKPASAMAKLGVEFMDYACEYFSDHIKRSSSEDVTILDALLNFLERDLLSWIEYLAKKRKLSHITRTANNLQAYLRRNTKYLSSYPTRQESLEAWINDLIRVNAKFGPSLDISPSSIPHLIPAMCPSDSPISKTYGSRQPGLHIKGRLDTAWDDCLTRIDYPALRTSVVHRTSTVAHGEDYTAIAISDGNIFLYFKESMHAKTTLIHGEWPKNLAFSSDDEYLVSSGNQKVKVWNPAERSLIWSFDTDHQVLALLFIDNNVSLTAATRGNYTITWDLRAGAEIERWNWTESVLDTASIHKPHHEAELASFSLDCTTLAISYRRLPLYLFNIQMKKFIGCCRRDAGPISDYLVDGLVLNPRPEINTLVVSYSNGEIAVFDTQSTELCFRRRDVYAHCLACSPNGRTIVTGSAQGTIQIFEFTGARRETLSLIYRINSHEEGIRGIAFSSDGLSFSDIRVSQYRLWKPAVLACNNLDEGSQSEMDQVIPPEPTYVRTLERLFDSGVTVIFPHPDGDFVFYGKRDGSISYFETDTAQSGILYRHKANLRITCITYLKGKSLLITGDQVGCVLIKNLKVSPSGCEIVSQVADIRPETLPIAILGDPSGSKVLIQGMESVEVWTIEGQKINLQLQLQDTDKTTLINHPLQTEQLISMSQEAIQTYSWLNLFESKSSIGSKVQIPSVAATPPSPALQLALKVEDLSHEQMHQQTSQFIARLHKGNMYSTSPSDVVSMQVWPASAISGIDTFPRPMSIPLFEKYSNRIQQLIGTFGGLIIFLDTDLWVCSLDLMNITSGGHGAKRHFFLLSEWQNNNGSFTIEYMPSKREFVVGMKDGILVLSRGLEFDEPWFS